MVGLGETFDEVVELMKDLRKVNCDIMTIGQYFSLTKEDCLLKDMSRPKNSQNGKKLA